MKLIDEALDPIIKFYKDFEPTIVESHPLGYEGPYYTTGSPNRTVNIRIDAEVESEFVDVGLDFLASQAKYELYDLIVNGDTSSNDPTIRYFDGTKKRGKELSKLEINSASLYREWKAMKDGFEYTLYLVIYVEWEE